MYLVMFFSLYPMAAILIGIISGQDIKACWFQPLLFSALFVLGTWIFLKMGESDFLSYGARYLILGYAVALLHGLHTEGGKRLKKKCKRRSKSLIILKICGGKLPSRRNLCFTRFFEI